MKETIIQFGEGNFLRGFVDYFIQKLNDKGLYEGKVAVIKPIAFGDTERFTAQNCEYNLFLRGIENGKEVTEHTKIDVISRIIDPYVDWQACLALAKSESIRFVISNTTEAGIAFDPACKFDDPTPSSFPAKLTRMLYERFSAGLNGLVMLACELIDKNADELKRCVLEYAKLWNLSDEFVAWIENENKFCNTLVDRIVTGYPADEAEELCKKIGYKDNLIDTAEIFHLWVIQGNFEEELPLQKAGFNVIWTDDVAPFKKMKVRILNGAHTSTVFPSLLCGIETVRDSIADEQLNAFLNNNIKNYILPQLDDTDEIKAFADAVLGRFANPYIKHMWIAISLNSVSKFSVRVLPTVLEYIEKNNSIPKPLAFSLACLIEYYKNNDVQDDQACVDFIKNNSVEDILKNDTLWGTSLENMTELVNDSLNQIHTNGIREAIQWSMS